METELISTALHKFNTDVLVIHLQDSAAHLYLLVLATLVLTDHTELDLVFVRVDLGLDTKLLEVLKDGILDHIWVVGREELGVL